MYKYRMRIYDSYSSARASKLAPVVLAGLRPRSAYLNVLIKRCFPSDKSSVILDIGCGHGAVIHFGKQAGYNNITGIDGSSEQVDAAKQLGIEDVSQCDLIDYLNRLPPASLDCVIAFDVIEHFTRDELIDLIDLVNKVLKPGGRWIIHTPNGESPFSGRMLFGDFTHETLFTRTSLNQVLLSSGFSNVDCYEDAPIVHGAKSFTRLVLWKLIRLFLRLYLVVETGDAGRNAIFSQNFLAVAYKIK